MIDKNTSIQLLGISNEIMGLFSDKDLMSNGDFQGCLEAQVMKAYFLGKGKTNALSQSSVDFINDLLDNEYNSPDMDDDYRDEIQDVQGELDLIEIKGEN